MLSFQDIETKYKGLRFHSFVKNSYYGHCDFAANKTELTIYTELSNLNPIVINKSCHYRYIGHDGNDVIFYNTIQKRMTQRSNTTLREYQLFPNLTILNASDISEDLRICEIIFGLDGLENFFSFDIVENHLVFDLEEIPKNALTQLREAQNRRFRDHGWPNKEYDFDDPSEIIFVHKPPKTFEFEHDGKIISHRFTSVTGSGFGKNAFSVELVPYISIKFNNRIDVNKALDYVYYIKLFFSEIAFCELDINRIAVRSSIDSNFSPVYYPLYERRRGSRRHEYLSPTYLPFVTWQDRKNVSMLLYNWLQKDRKEFRIHLGRALNANESRSFADVIIPVCAGIDSLTELPKSEHPSKDDTRRIRECLERLCEERSINIPNNRINTLVSMLRNVPLKDKLYFVSSEVQRNLKFDHTKIVIENSLKARRIAAHGTTYINEKDQIFKAAAEALLGIAVLFDLGLAPLTKEVEQFSSLPAALRLKDAAQYIAILPSE